MMRRALCLLMVLMGTACFGVIIETNTIFDVEKHLDADTLLIYDLDNTLMETAQTLGSDQWFYHRWMQLKRSMGDTPKALDRALSEWVAIQTFTDVKEVEPGTADLIGKQQRRNVVMIGLTTRDLSLATCTCNQLERLDIDLTKTSPYDKEVYFQSSDRKSILFRKGILFTSGSHKGEAFLTFLEKAGLNPKRVLFINDKHANISQVANACYENKIPFMGLRYSYLDEKIAAFDKNIAQIQVDQFGVILSDEEALKRMKEFAAAS